MASSLFLLSATALRSPAVNLLKNKFLPNLHPIRSLLSVTYTPPSSSAFHSSTKNNAASVASQRVTLIPYLINDDDSESDDGENEMVAVIDGKEYPSAGSLSRLPLSLRGSSPNLLSDEADEADDDEEEAENDLGWVAREDEEAVYLKMDLPGVGKEDLKISVEGNTLVIKGVEKEDEVVMEDQGDEQNGQKGIARSYRGEFDLPSNRFKVDQVKAEIKNGVLKVSLPKVKEEERKDIFHVQVQ